MKLAAYLSIAIILSWTALALGELWFDLVSTELFIKLTISAGLLLVAVVVAAVIHREYRDEKNMKDQNYLD